jgi:hypothetical protein
VEAEVELITVVEIMVELEELEDLELHIQEDQVVEHLLNLL